MARALLAKLVLKASGAAAGRARVRGVRHILTKLVLEVYNRRGGGACGVTAVSQAGRGVCGMGRIY